MLYDLYERNFPHLIKLAQNNQLNLKKRGILHILQVAQRQRIKHSAAAIPRTILLPRASRLPVVKIEKEILPPATLGIEIAIGGPPLNAQR
jgi:hypothetical protein